VVLDVLKYPLECRCDIKTRFDPLHSAKTFHCRQGYFYLLPRLA
jgi:hypothetical protein